MFFACDFVRCYDAYAYCLHFFFSVSSWFVHVGVEVFWDAVLVNKLLQVGYHFLFVVDDFCCAEDDYAFKHGSVR